MKRFTKFFQACISTVLGMPQAAQHQPAKGLQDWIEVFRSGTHVDSKGREATFTNADLDEMVANVALGKPPAVLGHPKHNDPAYAKGTFKREGDSLFAKFEDINPAFEAGVKTGAYYNRSLSVFKDNRHGWRVRHVGWLGAAPPAIDGLKPVEFEGADADVMEFAAELDPWSIAGALDDIAASLRGVRDSMLANAGVEAADAALPDWRITSIVSAAGRVREAARNDASLRPFSAPTGADMPFTQEDLDRTAAETEARVRAEVQAQQSADFTAATDLANRLLAERRTERIAAQITGWKAAGQLLPAEEAGLAEFMAQIEGEPGATAATFEFTAAAGGQPVKKTAGQFFADFVAARGALVKLGAKAGSETDPGATGELDLGDANAIARAAQDFQAAEAKEGRDISIATAVAHVTRKPAAKA